MPRYTSGPVVPALALALLAVAPCAAGAELRRTVMAMGTQLTLDLEGPSGEVLAAASERALAEAQRLEEAASTWRPDSRFSVLNQAGGRPVVLGPEWVRLLASAVAWSHETEGAFDPVLGTLLEAWGTRCGGRTPAPRALAVARAAAGSRWLDLDVARGTARLRHPHAAVEEGGFLKGYALDRMAGVLRRSGATSGVLDFGGQLLAFGRPTVVAVASPTQRRTPTFELALDGHSLSTSGTSERGRHILDPRTGEPSPAWGSVTVLAADAFTADILSTALFVLGPEDGRAWAEAHDVAALFQDIDGSAFATAALAPGALRAIPTAATPNEVDP